MAKSKFMLHYCAYCHKETKMEFVGEEPTVNGSEIAKSWYRCSKCKHSALLKITTTTQIKKTHSVINREECKEYSKEKTYSIGEAIYYPIWDAVGKVIRKDKMSNGTNSIIVAFEKLGERKLLENVTIEPDELMEKGNE